MGKLVVDSETSFNWGFQDGKASKKFRNPIHNNWPKGPHFNKAYEAGYWKGFNDKK